MYYIGWKLKGKWKGEYKHSHFSLQEIECEIPISVTIFEQSNWVCLRFHWIPKANQCVLINIWRAVVEQEASLLFSPPFTLFIANYSWVGSFQIRFRWNIFVPGCSFSYKKRQTTKKIHRVLDFRKKYSFSIDAILHPRN